MDHICRVRLAAPEDAEDPARLHLECWRETYAHLLSPGFMAGQGVEGRLAMRRHLLAGPHARRQYVAADAPRPSTGATASSLPGARDTIEDWEGLAEDRMARPARR